MHLLVEKPAFAVYEQRQAFSFVWVHFFKATFYSIPFRAKQ